MAVDPKQAKGLHANLRAWRRFASLTQEQLANKIGSKISTISGWETGARDMDLVDLERIARAYGIHPALLLMAPSGSHKLEALQEVSRLWDQMPSDVFSDWLNAGKRMVQPSKPDVSAGE